MVDCRSLHLASLKILMVFNAMPLNGADGRGLGTRQGPAK